MHDMTNRERDDFPVDLYCQLLEQEIELIRRAERLLQGDQPRARSASTARPAPTATPAGQIRLAAREADILPLLILGYTNRQMGAQLQIHHGSVRNRLSGLFRKLGVTTRTQAAVRAVELGLCRAGLPQL
jgi:DNA-binding NarL/FixJ family response regulator